MTNLIVMCGISGSGKSTWAREFSEAARNSYEIVSTDAIRKELFGDENIQSNGDKVFDLAYSRITSFLNEDKSVIFDATNLSRKDRIRLIKRFKGLYLSAYCAYTYCSVEEAMARQLNRERQVPREVVERQSKKFQVPTLDEGWDKVIKIE